MAVGGLLAVLDDLATIMDDVAAMSKIAARKTAGIAGDDLAVNANALIGIDPKRELPIVGKVALGSFINKLWLIPLALALPTAAITPLLMVGGAFLCYEGMHKALHKHDKEDDKHHEKMLEAIQKGPDALMQVEKKKVKEAIITDVVLSAEIVAVSLGAVAAAPLLTKAVVLSAIGIGMTVGIYGLVATLVKLDDIGLHLQKKENKIAKKTGDLLVRHTPHLMKGLSIIGTGAMFLVGGGIILHGIPGGEALVSSAVHALTGGTAAGLLEAAAAGLAGAAVGLAALKPVKWAGKAAGWIKKQFSGPLKKNKTDAVITAAPETNAPQAASTLSQTPDLAGAVNDAAKKPEIAVAAAAATPAAKPTSPEKAV